MALDADVDATVAQVLAGLDRCAAMFTFPALDNGYVYPAASRLSAYRSADDWALVIEVFGYSPRAGLPDIALYTFGSRILRRLVPRGDQGAYESMHPFDELTFLPVVEDGDWYDGEEVAASASRVVVRAQVVDVPAIADYSRVGVTLEQPPTVVVWELCRYLAETHRDLVLSDPAERRCCVPPELIEILVLDEWHHPDITAAGPSLPSGNETFIQLARVLATGDLGEYHPTVAPNSHWSNWPEAGTL